MSGKIRKKNADRAQHAENALRAYVNSKGENWTPGCEADANVTDLLTDLMHWCAWKRLAVFPTCLRQAEGHFTEESERREG